MFALFEELKRYVGFTVADEDALRELHARLDPAVFPRISEVFYARVLEHDDARAALTRGEKHVGQLKGTLVRWMNELVTGPWNEEYVERRARIGRMHVQISLAQHYMVSAMNIVRVMLREEACRVVGADRCAAVESALEKICDIDLALMLHTYRQDLESAQARQERLSTFGQLIGSIGHELRNPLGVIETSLYVLKGRAGEDERTKRHLDRISAQVTLANDIITQLLSLIREKPIARENVDLVRLVREALQTLPTEPAVTVDAPPALKVLGDAVQLRQVFVNLVQNAQHFATPTGMVVVRLGEQGDRAILQVDDSGPGIDPSVRNRLFEPLVTTRPAGIGLGLALVKRIVERHSGTVTAERSASLGGARFVVSLSLEGRTP